MTLARLQDIYQQVRGIDSMSQSAKTRYFMVIVMQIYIYRNITMSGNVSRKIDDGRQ